MSHYLSIVHVRFLVLELEPILISTTGTQVSIHPPWMKNVDSVLSIDRRTDFVFDISYMAYRASYFTHAMLSVFTHPLLRFFPFKGDLGWVCYGSANMYFERCGAVLYSQQIDPD